MNQPTNPTMDEQTTHDLLSLSMQLNRQAFAQPPVDNWLGSFLALLYERFPAIGGVHIVQTIGDQAVVQATAGNVPPNAGASILLNAASPVMQALTTHERVIVPDLRIYPILYGDEAVGALVAYTAALPPAIDDVLGALAVQIGAAIMQQTHVSTPQTGPLRRQVRLMQSLYQITREVSTSLEVNEIIRHATQSVVETLNIAHATVLLYDHTLTSGEVVAEYPDKGAIGVKVTLLDNNAMDQLRQFQAVIIENIDNSAPEVLGASKAIAQKFGIKSMLIMPLASGGSLLGAMTIDVYDQPRPFTTEEIEVVQALGSQLSNSIRNAQLFAELGQRAKQFELIAELSRRAMSSLDRDAILAIVAEQTAQLIASDGISVALHGSDEPKLYIYLLTTASGIEQKAHAVEFPYEETALRMVCNSGESLILDDISGSDYPDYKMLARHAAPDSWDTEPIMHAALVVPLLVGGRAIGTFNLTRKQRGTYTTLDLAVLEQIANQLSIALENARLFAQAASRVQTERLLNRMSASLQQGDLQSILLNTTQEIAEALGAHRARVRLQATAADPVTADRLRTFLDSKSFKVQRASSAPSNTVKKE